MIYNGNNTDIKNELKKIAIDEGITFKSIADRIGVSSRQFSNTFNKVNLSFEDLRKMLDAIGYDLKIEMIKRDLQA